MAPTARQTTPIPVGQADTRTSTLIKVRRALEVAGVEFVNRTDGNHAADPVLLKAVAQGATAGSMNWFPAGLHRSMSWPNAMVSSPAMSAG
jgi:hypothetical protein